MDFGDEVYDEEEDGFLLVLPHSGMPCRSGIGS